jgi:hypothetical protein
MRNDIEVEVGSLCFCYLQNETTVTEDVHISYKSLKALNLINLTLQVHGRCRSNSKP